MSYNNIQDILAAKTVSQDTLSTFNILTTNNKQINGAYLPQWKPYIDKLKSDTIIFPVFNLHSQLKGFIYRTVELKSFYDTSFNTKISEIVYGLHVTHQDIAKRDYVYVVEGLFDFLKLYDAGILNVVSTLGAKISIDQACLLARFAKHVIICYDNDPAGIAGSCKATDILTNIGVHAVNTNVGMDPDDYVRTNGADSFIKLCLDQLNSKEALISPKLI